MYNWPSVAHRTAAVYDSVMATPNSHDALLQRLRRYRCIGTWAGLVFCCVVVLLHWFWLFLEWQQPANEVEPAVDWPSMQGPLDDKQKQQGQGDQQQQRHQ
eukprot:GHRR01035037.1.p1 GENE.GHRR01035037.1~~GHRR01035037.1.p1  ORF type:complete len:101 (+),score=48.13 GHRR01035037.1:278-580(+)